MVSKSVGRPKGYQRDEVVDRALTLFREQGYSGTSVEDLVKATGINRYSLYDDFGDKRGLFLEVLNRFQRAKLGEADRMLSQPGPKLPLFRRHLESVRENGRRSGPVNCLVTVSAVNLASDDPEIAECLLEHFAALEKVFVSALAEAKAQGEIESDVDLLPLARTMINAARGMRIISQFEGLHQTASDIIDTTLALLRPTLAFQNARSE